MKLINSYFRIGVLMLLVAVFAGFKMNAAHLQFPQPPAIVGEIEGHWLDALMTLGLLGMACLVKSFADFIDAKADELNEP